VKTTMKKLGQIATIRTGYPFRGSVDRVEVGNCRIVQMGDVRASAGVVADLQAFVKLPEGPGKHVLLPGDVLFVGRGVRNEAATFTGDGGNVVAAPHLFVLRPNTALVLPDYLTWFLNLTATQGKIHALRSGSAVPFVPLTMFAELELPVPPMARQRAVCELYRLGLREQKLLRQIGEQRQLLLDGLMMSAVGRTGPDVPTEKGES
jgi:hypothetical protein